MKNILRYGIYAAVIYFGINWIADNPKAVERIRRTVNKLTAHAIDYAEREGGELLDGSLQSLDK